MTRAARVAFFLAMVPIAASAQQPDPIEARDAWARATPPRAAAGAVYVTLTSRSADKLTGASSPAAARSTVHQMSMEGEVMRMRPVEGGLDLPAETGVTLAPGGYHIMLEGLKSPLTQGESVSVRLTFEKAPPLDVTARILPIGASLGAAEADPAASPDGPGMNTTH